MPQHYIRGAACALLAIATFTGCATAVPSGGASVGAAVTLVTRLGTDTLAVERYTRTATRIDGVIAGRLPMATLARYTVQLGPDQAPLTAEYSLTRGDGSAAPGAVRALSLRFGPDSVTLVGHRAQGDTTRVVAMRGRLLPYVFASHGLLEPAFARLLAEGRASGTFALLPMAFGVRGTDSLPVRLYGPDSIRIDWFGDPMYGRHDGRGGIVQLDGRRTTDKVLVDRVANTDVEAVARRWGAREAVSGAAGVASTRDTTRATIGRAHVWVDYGRPSLRGRSVWVNGVLGDTLWRTGANAATQLSTDVDLVIGGQHVPAGTYSLFTWAGTNGYHLIVNRQAGQWGTEYDAARDLVRVPLRESDGAPSVERFTITVEPAGAGAASLVLAWGTRRLSVPISTM